MAEIERTKKFIKFLICLFAAAAILILTGSARTAIGSHGLAEDAAKVQAAAMLYVFSAEDQEDLRFLAETSPELLLYAASGSSLRPVSGGPAE